MPHPLIDLILLRPQAFAHACDSPRAAWWISGFLIGTGAVYGALLAAVQRAGGVELAGIPVERFSDAVLYGGNVLAGLLIVVVVHTGGTLIAWLMTRGVGGTGHLLMLYRAGAYVLPLAAPALPLIAASTLEGPARQAATLPETMLLALAAAGGVAVLTGLFQALRVSQGLTPIRAAAATALTAAFTASVLTIVA